MSVRLIASQSFSGPDGTHIKDAKFSAPADRAKWLTENGYAARVEKSDCASAADAPAASVAAPAGKAPKNGK